MNEQERELDLMVAELEQENRLLRARNERLESEALAKDVPETNFGNMAEQSAQQDSGLTNRYTALQQAQQQEPVAWLDPWTRNNVTTDYDAYGKHGIPLYTRPPARKPLTDEQKIAEALRRHGLTLVKTASGYDVLKLGQIDAHGIKENT